MQCPRCFAMNDENMKVCSNCGTELDNSVFNFHPVKRPPYTNSIAKALFFMGIVVMIVCFIAGIFTDGLFMWIILGVFYGLLIIGFSEIIHLLQKIYENTKK